MAASLGGYADSETNPGYHRASRRASMTLQRRRIAIPLALVLVAMLASLAADQPKKEQMSVTVNQSPVRDRPSVTGKVIANLKYCNRVTIEEAKGDWFRVSYLPQKLASGWMHRSALVTKEIQLKEGERDAGSTASSGEVALAGRGISKAVEDEYRKGANLNYGAVEDMAKYTVAPESVIDFITRGGLLVEGGTQ
jgi:hypothetical protein